MFQGPEPQTDARPPRRQGLTLTQSFRGRGLRPARGPRGWSFRIQRRIWVGLVNHLPVLGGAQVGGDGIVLDGLVQHQGQKTGTVSHGSPQVPLLLEQLVQLVPLSDRRSCDQTRVIVRSWKTTFERGGYHADSLQVHLGPPQLLPAVVFVALPLRDPAELSGGLEHVFDQRTAADLICWDLRNQTGTKS